MPQRKTNDRRYVIDSTPHSAVVRCLLCEWRGLSHGKPSAYRQVAAHLVTAHGERRAAYDARQSAETFHRRLSSARPDSSGSAS